MRRISLLISLFISALSIAAQQPDWENHYVLQINREPARAAFIGFSNSPSDRKICLDGSWKFHWSPTPGGRIPEFYTTSFNDKEWKSFPVPANWEVNGYGTPIYVSSGYPFRIDPPKVTSTPSEKYTSFKERNPVGQYRRTFTLPSGWDKNGQVFIRFEGVQSAFYVWINGKRVGYSQGSMEPSEFNVTNQLKAGENQIAVEVYKYCDGSYLEDQDMWRLGGIQRSISMFYTPMIRITDLAIRTIADKNYKNFTLEIDPKLSVFGSEKGKGVKICASIDKLFNVSASAADILNLDHKAAWMNEWNPQRGPRKNGRLKATVDSPAKWTAETPTLYTLTVSLEDSTGKILEKVQQKIGFRAVEIKDGQFLINGRAVRLRGVNRHEHDPALGKVMTEQMMLKDILLMKQANINAVRTCHYPNVSRWYELCDSIGMYVLDEADIEEHGLRGTLASDPDWAASFLDRTIRMAERDKNYPSVVMWSLGNEAGYGPNFAADAAWLKDFDPTRPVHYEGAQGLNSDPDPYSVDVISRFYPRVQEEYLNPGAGGKEDPERPENARWERLLSIAQRTNDNRPVMTSEYAHVMGNSLGNLQEYWDEMYSNKRMLGGFIWEWADEGIFKTLPNGKTQISYGGDFGDYPNLKVFCIKGVVASDRTLSPKYWEVKKVYQPIAATRKGNKIMIINRNHHISLDQFRCLWSIVSHNSPLRTHCDKSNSIKGEITLPAIAAGDSVCIDLPKQALTLDKNINDNDADVRFNLSFVLKNKTAWANAGYEVASEQFCLHQGMTATPTSKQTSKVISSVSENSINLKSSKISVSWNRKNGSIQSFLLNGKQILVKAREFELQPIVQAFRAPTDNDKGFGNWIAKDWKIQKLDSPLVVIDSVSPVIEKQNTISFKVYQTSRFKSGKISTAIQYSLNGSDMLDIEVHFSPSGTLPEIPRLGIALALNPDLEQYSWYGEGPWENYIDRKSATTIGLWKSTVTAQAFEYPKPQETGNHEDIRYLTLQNKNGVGLMISAVGKSFSASALHFSANDLANEAHQCALSARKEIILSLDAAMMGLGNSSCGPGVLKKYAVEKNEHVLHVRITPAH